MVAGLSPGAPWEYFILTGNVSVEDAIFIVDKHNEYRRNVTPTAANMMKMVRDQIHCSNLPKWLWL